MIMEKLQNTAISSFSWSLYHSRFRILYCTGYACYA